MSHPIQRRLLAEELAHRRGADDQRRWAGTQRAGRIDPNPHQIDAVVFALQRVPEGGCILADEVGLGKTIEAGLVLAQLRAEGARRFLLITPKPLLGQWQQELAALFGLEVQDASSDGADLGGSGVFAMGRELAGSEHGAERIRAAAPFDLCVIDEAHEIFANIYKRFDRHGRVRDEGRHARLAARVRQALVGTPVLLLTATPIQNSLSELWGLVQYVEPTGTLLGDLGTFRAVFCGADDRELREDQAAELRRRLATVCRRTLRRQAQPFMRRPFVDRRTQLFDYTMGPAEKALYDDVTAYLLRPHLCAFRGGARKLLVIGFHRRMASSIRALASSLDHVAARLDRMLLPTAATLPLWADDEEERDDEPGDEAPPDDGEPDELPVLPDNEIRRELAEVRALAERARALPHDAKAEQFVRAVRFAIARPRGSGRVVVFTESLRTQDYLRDLLIEARVTDDDITLFRGDNRGPRAEAALARWDAEVGRKWPAGARPPRDIAVRMALVHEFRTRSRIFVATEAGAKGLNLQFCDTVINYDLPWNPQRIEQRIGRCHRYGQNLGVLVINFLATDNAAQRLTFDILARKLDLFGTVLDASDNVLHEPSTDAPETLAGALGMDLEARLRRIYERARSADEIERELAGLNDAMGRTRAEFEATYERTAGLISARLDASVRDAFRRVEDGLETGLRDLDRDIHGVVTRWLSAIGVPFSEAADLFRTRLRLPADERVPEGFRGSEVAIGRADDGDDLDVLHVGHPLVRSAIEEARAATARAFWVQARAVEGRAVLLRLRLSGFEPVEAIIPVGVWAGATSPADAEALRDALLGPLHDAPAIASPVTDEELDDAIEETVFAWLAEVHDREHPRFLDAMDRIERHVEDRILVATGRLADLRVRLVEAQRRRDAAVGAEARTRAELAVADLDDEIATLHGATERLRSREDDDYVTWRTRALERRFCAPAVERLVEITFVSPR